jgi:hypothetical protein
MKQASNTEEVIGKVCRKDWIEIALRTSRGQARGMYYMTIID